MKTTYLSALGSVTCFLLICGTMILLPCAAGQPAPNNTKSNDNLELTIGLHATSRDLTEARAKRFIWVHFAQHHKGYLRVTRFSKEGEPSISRYHILPETSGAWKIEILIERHLRNRRTHQPIDRTDQYTAYGVELIDPKSQTPITDIPPGAGAGFFRPRWLPMTDKDGNTVTVINN